MYSCQTAQDKSDIGVSGLRTDTISITHKRYSLPEENPVVFEYKDPNWDWASDLIIKDLNANGWMNYTILPNDNKDQLELFNTIDFQTKDRFGNEMDDYTRMIYKGQAS